MISAHATKQETGRAAAESTVNTAPSWATYRSVSRKKKVPTSNHPGTVITEDHR